MLRTGDLARFSGTVSVKKGQKMISNPEFQRVNSIPLEKSGSLFADGSKEMEMALFPIYRESGIKNGKISSK